MTATELAAWVGAAFGTGGVITAIGLIIKARPEAKKIGADAAQVLTTASTDLVQRMAAQMEKMQTRIDTLEAKVDAQEEREEKQERRLIIHEQWDRKVAERLRDLGEPIPDPPPLYPDPVR